MRTTNKKRSLKRVNSSRKKRSSIKKTKNNKKTKNTKKSKKTKKTKKMKRRNTKKNRRGAGDDDDPYPVYSDAQIENMTTREMFNSLNEGSDNRKDFLKTYKNQPDDAQRLALKVMLRAQNRSNAAMVNYKKETEKHMVYEPGKMPYDARLTQDTQVDAPRTGFRVIEQKKPIKIWDPKSKYAEERAKAAFQKDWFKENPLDINNALADIERNNARYKPPKPGQISVSYVHKMHDEYYEAFYNFLKTEEFEKAREEQTKEIEDLLKEQRQEEEEREKREREEREERRRKTEEESKKRKREEEVRKAQEKQDRKKGNFDPKKEIYYSDVLYNGYYIGTSTKTGKKYTMLPSGKTKYVNMDVDPRVDHEVTTPNADTVIPDNYQSIQYSDEDLNTKFAPPLPPPPLTTNEKGRDKMRQRYRAMKEMRGKK